MDFSFSPFLCVISSPSLLPTHVTAHHAPSRLRAAAMAIATIIAGLAAHRLAAPSTARDIAGDALWASMMFWWVTVLWPTGLVSMRAAAALAISWVVEFSQLMHAPWLEQLRATRLGPLVLGTGFDPRDLASYAVGVLLAWFIAKRTGQ